MHRVTNRRHRMEISGKKQRGVGERGKIQKANRIRETKKRSAAWYTRLPAQQDKAGEGEGGETMREPGKFKKKKKKELDTRAWRQSKRMCE